MKVHLKMSDPLTLGMGQSVTQPMPRQQVQLKPAKNL